MVVNDPAVEKDRPKANEVRTVFGNWAVLNDVFQKDLKNPVEVS